MLRLPCAPPEMLWTRIPCPPCIAILGAAWSAAAGVYKIAKGKIKKCATLKDKIRKGGTKDPGTVPGGSGANPNAAKPGTGQTGAPVKQGNPPEKKVASVGEKPLNNPRILNPKKAEITSNSRMDVP